MSTERDIRFDLVARLCPNATGAELRSVATEAGMYAIRARRKVATERDFLDAVEKVIRQGSKFSSTAHLVSMMYAVCYQARLEDPRLLCLEWSQVRGEPP
ncbi:26s proteasome subunit p45 [Phaffia rhodozyma]|uniref:26s proteasome subunit p45 n=1 Tax=Phaffia rhodozyma TaxID=264483 RepID=A0A0F7SS10_PHARH|nr:26s proteasome subunit p45 [Phaffia rhodozyma]